MTLLDALQQINRQGMDAAQLTDMAVGTVTSTAPLEVTLDVHQAAISGDTLIFTETIRDSFFREVNGVLCAVWGQSADSTALTVGEKLLLLSVQHGQRFIVLSRL